MFGRIARNSSSWILLICAICLSAAAHFNYNNSQFQKLIKADGKGYYAYLPAVFIYGDLNFGHFEPIEIEQYPETEIYDYRYKLDRQRIYNKYYAGTAIMMAPFFLATHGVSVLMDWKSDGYANQYHVGISIAAIFYLGIALFFIGKILDHYAIRNWVKVIVFFAMVFGTNWFYYVVNEPAVSHVYSAALIPFFIWQFLRFRSNPGIQKALFLGLTLGLVILIRPINGIVVFGLPCFFMFPSSFRHFASKTLSNWRYWAAAVIGCIGVISIQFIIYKIQTDQFFLYSYVNEHLNLLQPNVTKFLFSYKKGMLVYTPMLMLSIIGIFFWIKRTIFQPVLLGLFLFSLVYLLSSWHMWWYGGGFATRVMVEYYLFWFIPLALLIQNSSKLVRATTIASIALLIGFCMLQTWQYFNAVLHWELMDKQKYWDVFLQF